MLKTSMKCVLLVGVVIGSVNWVRAAGDESAPASSPERFARVRAMILEALEKGGIPSISIAAAEDGKIVWEESFGYAEKEKQIDETATSHSNSRARSPRREH